MAIYLWYKEKQWDENESRARPAKEEPLWIRKGDERRMVSAKETRAAAYSNAIWSKKGER